MFFSHFHPCSLASFHLFRVPCSVLLHDSISFSRLATTSFTLHHLSPSLFPSHLTRLSQSAFFVSVYMYCVHVVASDTIPLHILTYEKLITLVVQLSTVPHCMYFRIRITLIYPSINLVNFLPSRADRPLKALRGCEWCFNGHYKRLFTRPTVSSSLNTATTILSIFSSNSPNRFLSSLSLSKCAFGNKLLGL